MYFRRLASLIAVFAGIASAADQWIRVTTPHFELLTTAGDKKAREAILYFEQVRSFFLQASPSKRVPEFPLRIIAFRSEKQYKPYRVNETAAAYYTGSHDRDYIVMQDIQPEHYPIAIHEYTHLIIRHSGLNIPLWMNEGWADLFSTLRPMGNKAVAGELIPGRVQTVLTSQWIPLSVLAGVDHSSPLYNERNRANNFYSESWVLMHMLFLGKRYSPHFGQFVEAIHSGKSLAEASQAALGVPADELEKDLHAYLTGNQLFAAVFPVKLDKSAEEAVITELPQFDADMALADVLSMIRKPDEARAAYERLAAENPGRPEVEESLGYLSWQTGDRAGAREHFSKAVGAGDKNPQMCYHYAGLAEESGDHAQAMAALRRAVELKPDYVEARIQLGSMLLAKEDFGGALKVLSAVKRVDEKQAAWLFDAMAFAYLRTGDRANARSNGELAKKWAKSPAAAQRAQDLLKYLDATERQQNGEAAARGPSVAQAMPEASDSAWDPGSDGRPRLRRRARMESTFTESVQNPVQEIEGRAQKLDCGGKRLRLTVATAQGPMTFEIDDPATVTIKNTGSKTRDFTCGAQGGYRVVVGYIQRDGPGTAAGIVRSLEF